MTKTIPLPEIGATVRATCGCHRNVRGVVEGYNCKGTAVEVRSSAFVGTLILNDGQYEAIQAVR